MRLKILTGFIFLGVLIGGIIWFSRIHTTATTPPSPPDRLRIGNIGEFTIYNPIARENGYFTKHGIDAEIHEYESGPPAINDLLAGNLDVAVAADFVGVNAIFTHPNIRILAQQSRHETFQMVVRSSRGIHTESDLSGKIIGVTRKSAGEYYLGRFLAQHGLKFSDVKIIDLTPPEMVSKLINGDIDAALTFGIHTFGLKKRLGDDATVWPAQAGQKTFALLYSTDEFIHTHPNVIKRYIEALTDAENFVHESPAEAQRITVSQLHYDPEFVHYLWKNFTFEQQLNQELLLVMEDQARWLIDNKLTGESQIPNYLNFIYFDALQQVKPRSVTIIH